MRQFADRRIIHAVAGLTALALFAAGCGSSGEGSAASPMLDPAASVSATAASSAGAAPASASAASASRSAPASAAASASAGRGRGAGVKVKGTDGTEVSLTGPIAARYSAASDAQRKGLGPVLMGSHNAGTRDSGVIFQQFKSGVITAKNADAGTPAYITWGLIRDAWNIERDASGKPVDVGGKNGSAGPLGAVTSDETASGAVKQTTFEHGRITFDTQTRKVEVTVNGKVVPAGL